MKPNKPIRSKDRFLVFGTPIIEDAEIEEVLATMKSGWLGSGPRVVAFEEEFARYKGVNGAIAVNSCTAALHLGMLVAGIGAGDEVITTALTFCATVNSVMHAGGTPVVADIDPVTLNIDPADLERKITPRTKAIVPVHFAGRACDMQALQAIAARHGLKIIEDCAHAIETEYHGQKAGVIGDIGCFSFYVTKNVVTGEGGMLLSRSVEDANRLRILRLHGMSKDAWKRFGGDGYKHYQVVECGYKYNMMDLQAAIGIHQLRRVEKYWKRREAIWNRYMTELADCGVVLPAAPEPDTRHAYHLFTLQVDAHRGGAGRDAFIDAMTAHNIGVGVHYLSLPEHPFYQKTFGWRPEDCPNAMLVGRSIVSIPISAKLTDDDVGDVIAAVKACLP